jgi:hypothetical protein
MRKFFALFCMMTALTIFVGCTEADDAAAPAATEEAEPLDGDDMDATDPVNGATDDPVTEETTP